MHSKTYSSSSTQPPLTAHAEGPALIPAEGNSSRGMPKMTDQKKREELLKRMDKMFAKSKLTEEDTIELGRKVNKAMAKRARAVRDHTL